MPRTHSDSRRTEVTAPTDWFDNFMAFDPMVRELIIQAEEQLGYKGGRSKEKRLRRMTRDERYREWLADGKDRTSGSHPVDPAEVQRLIKRAEKRVAARDAQQADRPDEAAHPPARTNEQENEAAHPPARTNEQENEAQRERPRSALPFDEPTAEELGEAVEGESRTLYPMGRRRGRPRLTLMQTIADDDLDDD